MCRRLLAALVVPGPRPSGAGGSHPLPVCTAESNSVQGHYGAGSWLWRGGGTDTINIVSITSQVFVCLLVLNFKNWFTSVYLRKLPQARPFGGFSPSQKIKHCGYELRDKTKHESPVPESI